MKIAVLGAGMVGRAIALDLAKSHTVTSFDLNPAALENLRSGNNSIKTVVADLSRFDQYNTWLEESALVVLAVPGFMGYKALEAVIKAGKHVVDISFFPEDALQLDILAREKKVTAITDCGVAPGMSNWILGRYNAEMKIDSFACYVGGLPLHPQPPFYYKAPFSPVDVIQEYLRPVTLIENGKLVVKAPMTDRELLDFGKAGMLEAFNTDGLRSLVRTMGHIPDMAEKTLRYPGHIDLIIALQQAGFLDTDPLTVKGMTLPPLDFTSRILLDAWKLGEEEPEFTVMKVILKGEGKTIIWDLYDEYDPPSKTSSMARSTGYTCTAAVEMISRGFFSEKGVYPPELIGHRPACFDFLLKYLQERSVNWQMSSSQS